MMFAHHKDHRKRQLITKEEIKFSTFSSYHLISLTARVRSKKQISSTATDDEDLVTRIDGKTFPKWPTGIERLIDSPASLSGGSLHNLAKTVYFLTFLKGKDHLITLEADVPPGTATFESLEVHTLNLEETLILPVEKQAEDGDRRPWLTFALDNLPLRSFAPATSYSRRKRDSDDVKIIVDGKVQGNILRTIKHSLWRYVGSRIPLFSSKTERETFTVNLPQGLHYLEFEADRMPVLHRLTLNFGSKPSPPPGIPTLDNPKWTEDFYDDTEDILLARMIFGEAEGQPKEAKTGVGFTVLNRLEKRNPNWGYSLREILLKENQYDGLWNKNTYDKVRDPLNDASETRIKEWGESCEVAIGIIAGSLSDPTSGATNFHSYQDPAQFPSWATEKTFKTKIGAISFYELER